MGASATLHSERNTLISPGDQAAGAAQVSSGLLPAFLTKGNARGC